MTSQDNLEIWIVSDDSYRLPQPLAVAKHLSGNIKVFSFIQNTPEGRPDIVFGIGEKTVSRILEIKKIFSCFTVNILDPRNHHEIFDLIVVPGHEPYATRPNMIKTVGLINPINAQLLENLKKEAAEAQIDKDDFTTLLVGGKHNGGDLLESDIIDLTNLTKEFIKKTETRLLVSTSKRTGKKTTQILKDNIAPEYFYEFGVTPEIKNPYQLFLSLSQYIIITGDSARMLSESCSSKKKVAVFDCENIGFQHRSLVKHLVEERQAKVLNPDLLESDLLWPDSSLNEALRIALHIKEKLENIS